MRLPPVPGHHASCIIVGSRSKSKFIPIKPLATLVVSSPFTNGKNPRGGKAYRASDSIHLNFSGFQRSIQDSAYLGSVSALLEPKKLGRWVKQQYIGHTLQSGQNLGIYPWSSHEVKIEYTSRVAPWHLPQRSDRRKSEKNDRGSTRNYNLLIRSQTRYHYATRPYMNNRMMDH